MLRALRQSAVLAVIRKTFKDRFRLAKLTYVPVVGRLVEYMGFEGDRIYYLPKDDVTPQPTQQPVRTVEKQVMVNQQLTPTQTVLPTQIIEHFIEQANYHWVMNFCICRLSSSCDHYPINLGCLFLGEAAERIDPRLGRKVSKEEALEHVQKCKDAGLVHLVGRNKIDTQWLDLRPGNKLMTICHCCDCCCLWRMLPNVHPQIRDKVTKLPGVEVKVEAELCLGCGECAKVCFVGAIDIQNNAAVISDECRGCGRCVEVCPNGAIALDVTDANYVQKTIHTMDALLDLS